MTAEATSIALPIAGNAGGSHADAVCRPSRTGPSACSASLEAEPLKGGSVERKEAR